MSSSCIINILYVCSELISVGGSKMKLRIIQKTILY